MSRLYTMMTQVHMRGSLTVSYNTLVVAGQFVATLTCGAFASVHEASRDISL